MFEGLYFCNEYNGTCCDYVADGVYFTFVFRDGRCFEHNEEKDRLFPLPEAA